MEPRKALGGLAAGLVVLVAAGAGSWLLAQPTRREVDAMAFELIELRFGPYAEDPNQEHLRSRRRRTSSRVGASAHALRQMHVKRYLTWRDDLTTGELWDSVMVWDGSIPEPLGPLQRLEQWAAERAKKEP